MENSTMSLLIGGAIALTSGIIVQIVNSIINSKYERSKFAFEKLEDIINSISLIEEGMQQDAASIWQVSNGNTKKINLSYEQNRLECLIKIYHPELSDSYNNLIKIIDNYLSIKRNIINIHRQKKNNSNITNEYIKLHKKFEEFADEINNFIEKLAEYGSKKVKK